MISNEQCYYCGSELTGSKRYFCCKICCDRYWAGVYSKRWRRGQYIVRPDHKPTKEEIENADKRYQARRLAYKKYKSGDIVKCDLCGEETKHIHRHHEDYDRPEVFMVLCSKCHGIIKRYKNLLKIMFKINVSPMGTKREVK